LKDGWGCSVEGLGVANYGGMKGVYLVGDWCSGRVFGLGWDGGRWQLEEILHTSLQFTAGGYDEDGKVLAVDCNCFYTSDRGPTANPPGALWRVVAANEVPPGAETARTVQLGTAPESGAGPLTFLHPLDNSKLELNKLPNETITPAVRQFHSARRNPYSGQNQAVEAGRALYTQWCAACHLPDGTGRIGANLVDSEYTYPRVKTDVGMFEVIYAGATGAMQAFGDRVSQDDILKIMAYLETLGK
jgi:cytochrome c(L)